jgi:hypothetical protein
VVVAELRDACQRAFRLANRIQRLVRPRHSTSYHSPVLTGDADDLLRGLRAWVKMGEAEILLEEDWTGKPAEELIRELRPLVRP